MRTTPVEKVTELLVKLKEQTTNQAAKEKGLFQKFNDYCHSQEDEKFWRAAKAAKKVDRLDREIEDHEAQIEKKLLEVEGLKEEIRSNRESIQHQTEEMHARSADDAQAIEDLDTVISQCKRAIKHLQDSDVSGTAFTQLANMLESTLKLAKLPRDMMRLTELLQGDPNAGKPHKYKFHSADVIKLLEDLNTQFKDQRLARDKQALRDRRDSEHSISALQNLVDSQIHKKDECQGEADQHAQEKGEKSQDRALTDKNLFADVDFEHHLVGCDQLATRAEQEGAKTLVAYLPKHLDTATGCPSDIGECGEKRNNYAARKKTRAEELVALTRAIELLQNEGGQSYTANKRLTALPQMPNKQHQVSSALEDQDKLEERWAEDLAESKSAIALTFLQVNKQGRINVHQKLEKFLVREEHELKSAVLASVLLKVKMGDHFKDIRKLITDLIAKLEKQVLAEQEQKDWCDEQVKSTTEKHETAKEEIATASSTIDQETARRNLLRSEISALQKEIAMDLEAKEKATAMRSDEKAENKRVVAVSNEGLHALDEAIKVLSEFYDANANNSALVQQHKGPKDDEGNSVLYRAQGEGADGKTISDSRPQSDEFDTEYDGNQAESKGIIGILQIIKADYERTIDTTEKDEEKANEEWQASDERLAGKIADAENTVADKGASKAEAEETITTTQGELASAEKEHKLRTDELNQLKPLCSSTAAADQLDERRKRREQEVASLREALDILREFK